MHTGTILDAIVARKHQEILEAKQRYPLAALQAGSRFQRPTTSLRQRLLSPQNSGIIAEFKRRSPSKGWLHQHAVAAEVAAGYTAAGAAGMSVLTDADFFGGAPFDLQSIDAPTLPLLRKDFMVDEYQFYEARAWGASVVLLIAACLQPAQTLAFTRLAHSLQMEVLLEVHTLDELNAHYHSEVDMVGVNCRNLKTFALDKSLFQTMAAALPADAVKVAESGIDAPETIVALRKLGYKGFLMGEQFMKQPLPAQALRQFVQGIAAL